MPEIPATLITTDLLLHLDANNTASYQGSGNGNIFYDLSANLNQGTLSTSTIANTASTPKKFTFNGTPGTNVSFDPAKFNVAYNGKTVLFAAKMDANFATTKIYKGKGLTSTEVTTQFDLTKNCFAL